MTLNELLLMRHEWMLLLTILIMLGGEITMDSNQRKNIHLLAIGTMGIVTVTGFLPIRYGSLFGGMYITDPMRILMKNLLYSGLFIIFMQSTTWLNHDAMKNRTSEFYLLLLSSVLGASYLISSGHFLMFYLSLELLTLPVAALAAFVHYQENSAEAGIKLILSSGFASAILLMGIAFIYGSAGTLYFHHLVLSGSANAMLGFAFLLSGLAFKISLVPFHLWTADVYEGSPTPVTAYLSVISKGAAVFALALVAGELFKSIEVQWSYVMYALAILTMTIGNLFALRQQNIKRFLAFSSIAQAGFIMLGIVRVDELGITSVLYFFLVYIFSNLAAFGVVIAVERVAGRYNIADYNGFYSTNPSLSLVMMLAMFSLAGIPPLAGFFGKFFLFMSAAQHGYYVLLGIAVLNAVIALYYYLLVVRAMFIAQNDHPVPSVTTSLPMKVALAICTTGIMFTGFFGNVFEWMRKM
jgi:NADH-quinone oxidoreductase subunit N